MQGKNPAPRLRACSWLHPCCARCVIHARPTRLGAFSYRGPHRYHVRSGTWNRHPHFSDASIACPARSQLMQLALAFGFAVHAYCFMPDHVHLLVEGTASRSWLPAFVDRWKQATAYTIGRPRGIRLWQPGYFERVLREQESSRAMARYIMENPIRGRIARRVGEFPFAWCLWMNDSTL